MKKIMLMGLLAISTVASVAYAVQSDQTSEKGPQPCKKVILTCPDGSTYYKCVNGTANSPDCWIVGWGCNITEYPCHGGPVGL